MNRHSRLAAATDSEILAETLYLQASRYGDSAEQELREWHESYAALRALKKPLWIVAAQRLLIIAVLGGVLFGLAAIAEGQLLTVSERTGDEIYSTVAFLCLLGMIFVFLAMLAVVFSFASLLVPEHAPPNNRTTPTDVNTTDARAYWQRRGEHTL